ncbi:hypothetical protein B0H11DRAFT_1968526 [Mycena galericulata]|nr:hypothetical protein B0H11DRAFT_1968526 [Mycena galericulata]
MNFAELPPELVEAVYHCLDTLSIVRLGQVSRQFQRVLQESSALGYKLQLEISGLRDVKRGNAPPGSVARLQILKAYRAAWASFNSSQIVANTTFKMDGHLWELVGNVLATYSTENGFSFIRIPSAVRRIPPAVWTITTVLMAVNDFSLDLSQDLLLVVEVDANSASVVHLLSLQTGCSHPSARHPRLSADIVVQDTPPPLQIQIRIFGDHVGVMTETINAMELLVWEWKSGIMKKHVSNNDMTSFAFLDDCTLLVSAYSTLTDMPPELQVLKIDGHISQMTEYFSFVLPVFSPRLHLIRELDMTIQTEPRTSWPTESILDEPFTTCHTDRLFVVSLRGWETLQGTEATFMLCFLYSTLADLMDNPPKGIDDRTIVWDKWGPFGTRMLRVPQLPDPWVCFVHGQRCVLHTHRARCKILDFKPLSTQDRITHEKTVDKKQNMFLHPVTTSAPFALMSVDISPSAAVMLAEDGIVTVSPEEDIYLYNKMGWYNEHQRKF